MKRTLPLLFSALALTAADAPRPNRTAIATAEKRMDDRIQRMWGDNPLALVGASRGVYLPGYGIVFTAEMNLATANISMMNPSLSEPDKLALHKKRLERMPQLRTALKEMLVTMAASLDAVTATDKIAVALVLPRFSWEDPAGVPLQVIAIGTKQQLLAAQKAGPAAIDQAVTLTESN